MSDEAKTEKQSKKPLPTHEEIEKMVNHAFPNPKSMCRPLCDEFAIAWELLQQGGGLPGSKQHAQLLARLHAIELQMLKLHCNCTPE
jgi:hypothetical protein